MIKLATIRSLAMSVVGAGMFLTVPAVLALSLTHRTIISLALVLTGTLWPLVDRFYWQVSREKVSQFSNRMAYSQ